jgi:NTE family protein
VNALVLSGGNIKGAFQAGAVAAVLDAGYRPEVITGISVGALNGGFLVSRSARAARAGALGWPAVGRQLVGFWRERITGPDVVLRRRNALEIGWRLLRKDWAGLVALDRLDALIRQELHPGDFTDPPVRYGFGAVSLDTGRIGYSPGEPGTADRVVDYIIASTREPIGMPLQRIGEQSFYDGGLRDIAPLKQAIGLGATGIVCVACQPADPGPVGPDFERGDPLDLVGRVMEIVTNELLNGDLETLLEVNRTLVEAGPVPCLAGKRSIPLLVIRPAAKITGSLTKFDPEDVARMIGLGEGAAIERISAARNDPDDPGHQIALGLSPS